MGLSVSFVIGTLNERRRLPEVVASIKAQTGFSSDCEILIADGGSTDGTLEFARSEGCTIVDNPLVRCEPGIALGVERARGDIAVTMAADNPLHTNAFLSSLRKAFEDPRVVAMMPRLVSTPADSAANRYFNAFTDPFNHFVYWDETSTLTYPERYLVSRKDGVSLYDFAGAQPLVAMAQGFAFRRSIPRMAGTEEDDVLPAQAIVSQGLLAVVDDAQIEHHTVGGVGDFLAKFEPRIAARLRHRGMPVWVRESREPAARRLRRKLWPFYGISFVFPAIVGIYGALRDRRSEWLMHPIMSFALAVVFWKQVGIYIFSRVRNVQLEST